MKKILLLVLLIALTIPFLLSAVDAGQYGDEIIVKYKDNVSAEDLNAFLVKHGSEAISKALDREYIIRYFEVFYSFQKTRAHKENPFMCYKVPDAGQIPAILEALNSESIVEYAEPNYIRKAFALPNDPEFVNLRQWGYIKVSASAVYDQGLISSGLNREIKVAVLDSGINYNHEDLAGNTVVGYDFVNNDSDPADDDGHGTNVSGIIAANTNNSLGMAGTGFISGTAKVLIMPVKVLDNAGDGYDADIYAGFMFAINNGARVINCSFGGKSGGATVANAVNEAVFNGILVVAASGNAGGTVLEDDTIYPAGYSNVLSVGATDSSDARTSFSVYGKVDVMAPGESITSCEYSGNSSYENYLDGTSFAAPFVSGAAALLMLKYNYTDVQTRDRIEQTCDDVGDTGYDNETGWGRLNVYRAMQSDFNIPSEIKTYNWPNPFSPEREIYTNITFSLDFPADMEIVIYDAAGDVVWKKDMKSYELIDAYNTVKWDGKNIAGQLVANGVYFYVIKTGGVIRGKNKIAVLN